MSKKRPPSSTNRIVWHPVSKVPPYDEDILLWVECGMIFTAIWYDMDWDQFVKSQARKHTGPVTHWAKFPEGPNIEKGRDDA